MLDFLFTKTHLAFLIQSLWRDEAFTYLLARKNIFEIIYFSAFDFSPPLYYLVMHIWLLLAGKSELALRTPSLMFYWATLYVAFLYMRDVLKTKKNITVVYLLFFAVNPLLTYFAFEARMYTMMSFLGTLSFYFFATKNKKGHFYATLAGLFTHYFMLFVPFVQYVYLKFFEPKEIRKEFIHSMKKAMFIFVPYFLFFLTATYWAGGGSFWLSGKPTFFRLPAYLYVGFDGNLGFFKNYFFSLSLLLWFVIALGVYILSRLASHEKKQLYLILLWAFVPPVIIFFVSFFKPLFLGRYLIFATVGFLFFIVYTLHKLPLKLQAVILLILFFFTYNFNALQIEKRRKGPSRRVFREIRALLRPGDVVYVTSELSFHEAQYYVGENRVYIYAKSSSQIPQYVGKVLIPSDRLTSSLPTYPSRAFVVNPDLSYEIQSLY